MTHDAVYAVVPIKALDIAKQRLAPLLAADQRAALVIAMLRDVLAAIALCPAIAGTVIASADPTVAAIAAEAGADICTEDADLGMNQAIAAALGTLNAQAALILPGDIPCVSAAELTFLLHTREAGASCSLVPAQDSEGTNAMLLAPPAAFAPAYGPHSFDRHVRLARAMGLQPAILRLPGIGLDIDTFEDLAACRAPGRHTRELLGRVFAPL